LPHPLCGANRVAKKRKKRKKKKKKKRKYPKGITIRPNRYIELCFH